MKKSVLIDGNGLALTGTTTKASVSDQKSAIKTVDSLKIGKRIRRPKRLGADKGYDSYPLRKELRQRGIKSAIRNRNFEHRKQPEYMWNDQKEIRYNPCRWKVERNIACLDQNRRLDFLYETTRKAYESFLTIARIKSYVKVLARTRKH